jgi:hypothetical protein
MKLSFALVFTSLAACAVMSCSGGSSSREVDADVSDVARRVDTVSSSPDGRDTGATKPEVQALDTQAPDVQVADAQVSVADAQVNVAEVTPSVDAGVDQAGIGPEVGAGEAGAPDRAGSDSPILNVGPEAGVSLGADAGPDATAPDVTAAEARLPDATPPDTSKPDASVDVSAAEVLSVDATNDSSPILDAPPAMCGKINCDCTYKGIKLWGDVQYVTDFPQIKIKRSSFPDLNVHETTLPTQCGEWHTVTAFPNFTVQLVDFGEEFSIADWYFPGVANPPNP